MKDVVSVTQEAQVKWLALFVSDIHLCPDLPHTTTHFLNFLTDVAPQAKSLYLLGDLFEYWVGDDDMDSEFNRLVVEALRQLSKQTTIYWLAGNRDFLVGEQFFARCQIHPLTDPVVIEINDKKIGLSHGDLLCTDDTAYQEFRRQVRTTEWQTQFLQQSLAQRKAIAAQMRQRSKMAQQNHADFITDANPQTCRQVQQQLNLDLLIHGHTHRPALHQTEHTLRAVLPDWDLDSDEKRGGWFAVTTDGKWVLHQFQKPDLLLPF